LYAHLRRGDGLQVHQLSPPVFLLNKTFWEASIDNNISKRGEEEKAVHTRTHACSILVSLQ